MDTKKQELIDALIQSEGNITEALTIACVKYSEYEQFKEDLEFLDALKFVNQQIDDIARTSFMKLVKQGNPSANIEYQKHVTKRETTEAKNNSQLLCAKYLIEMAETKSAMMRAFIDIFDLTTSNAEHIYKKAIAKFKLMTPNERKKLKDEEHENAMSTMFERGELSEIEMYRRMLSISLNDAERAEYPSERSRAREDVIKINQRIEEIQKRLREESQKDDIAIIDKVDAILFGTTPQQVQRFRDSFKSISMSNDYEDEDVEEEV